MKVSIKKDVLTNVLDAVSNGISSRSPLPLLSCVLIEGSSGSLKFRATNLEIDILISSQIKFDGKDFSVSELKKKQVQLSKYLNI